MTTLSNLLNRQALSRLVADRYIRQLTSPDGTYILYDYTEKATFDRVWTPETRQCRGLVVRATDECVVCRPFPKFSNLDEAGFPESALATVLARPGPVELTEKLDGSMVALWWDAGEWHASTRGSFVSRQAQAALAWVQAHTRMEAFNAGLTIIGEWCAPDNQVVLRYEWPEFRLIGARVTATGSDADHATLLSIGAATGLSVVPLVGSDVAAMVATTATARGVEGWVARWLDGFRVKIKTAEYLRLHRLIAGLTPARLRDVLLADGDTSYLTHLPEEFRTEGERILEVMRETVAARCLAIQERYADLAPLLAEGRKAFAVAVQQEPRADWPLLFALADGRDIRRMVLSTLDLAALFTFEELPA